MNTLKAMNDRLNITPFKMGDCTARKKNNRIIQNEFLQN